MDFVSPVISLLSCSIDYAIRLATSAENLDQMTIDLEKAMEELSEVRDDLNKQVDQAESLGLTLTSQVNGWLARVERAEADVGLIRDDITNRNQHQMICCRCLSRYGYCDKLKEQLVLVNDLKGKGHAIIGSLKNACFLETGEDESRVKMHGVIRSFALWIVSGDRKLFIVKASEGLLVGPPAEEWELAERVSLVDNEIKELSGKIPICTNLSTLLLQWNSCLSKISDEFFQEMPSLKVLDLSFTSIKELPESICNLTGIRHLDLSGTKLRTLPRELGSLKKLQHLNVQRNQHLITIPREAISGLSRLRALNLYYSYCSWDLQDSIEELRLADLECLMSLDSLGITVTHLSSLTKVSRSESLRKCIQYLYIKECEGLYHLPVSSYPGDGDRLRRLSINNCMDLKYLAVHEAEGRIWLPNLEFLSLNGLPRLRSIWGEDGGMSYAHGCLMNLRCVNIWYCHKLKSVSWVLRLPKLETLYVFYCREMEEVVREEDVTEEDYTKAFPKLRNLSIRDVPELKSICGRAIFFPSLRKIAVIDCPKLRKLPLKAHTASEMPTVYCYKEWWENLTWDDDDTKHNFLPYFTEA